MPGASFQALFASRGISELAVTYKGRGTRSGTDSEMSYGTVSDGSAPAAGDLVIWNWIGIFQPFSDLTSAGWATSRQQVVIDGDFNTANSGVFAKVLVSGDLSSPPDAAPSTGANLAGQWIAFTLSVPPTSVTIGGHSYVYSDAPAPSNRTVNSSALDPPAVAVTLAAGTGSDNSVTFGGLTFDSTQQLNDLGGFTDYGWGFKVDVGGASYSISKTDDGNFNSLAGAYVAVA